MPKSETTGENKPVSTKTEKKGPAETLLPEQHIYLGPAVRTGGLHLEPRRILKQKPELPEPYAFLAEFIVPVKDHGAIKARLAEKYPVAALKVRAMAKA